MSAFIRESIEKKLAELRYQCGLQRLHVRNASGRRWARAARSNAENDRDSGPSDKYWDDLQSAELEKRTGDLAAADQALAEFIAEHRPLMEPNWVGNDHGRLCWATYLGGYPINQHYCQREEGHEGNHADEWPEHRWACEHPRGSWPQGVTGDREWRELVEARKAERLAEPLSSTPAPAGQAAVSPHAAGTPQ